ncbi:unnamed protein product [Spirodela intermedia]|uniref:Isopenicillin N synthase-like Fe(2+) 2OG dioxygenase domain-containing protein n=1 Tax=Spirodela intermedia TaxID=51605 RepID=A0A7I8J654_SPIIN|nr:unnamed protein product [Spirodela intermedia]CAA6665728.1 unnamed protein product [Spirodela intermedia]
MNESLPAPGRGFRGGSVPVRSGELRGREEGDSEGVWGVGRLPDRESWNPSRSARADDRRGAALLRSSQDEKRAYSCDSRSPASEGYGSRMLSKDDSVLDWRDYFDHHTLPLSRRNPSREVVAEYSDAMRELAQKLLRMASESLSLAPSFIEEAIGEVYQNITVSFYPPCPQPELALGLQSHSDMGAITLLIQDDVGGLEIITNGEYRSSVHRAVVNPDRPRLSVAAFYDPSKSVEILPAAPLVAGGGGSPARYRGVVYGDYVSSWYRKGPDGKRNIDALLIDNQRVDNL